MKGGPSLLKPVEIYHEAPLCIFDEVSRHTDGDYALVHKLVDNERYAAKFIGAKAAGRKIILDNSAYELGASFNSELFACWVESLQPDIYIVPDAIRDPELTVANFYAWKLRYPRLAGKKMGVVQGLTVDGAVECAEQLIRAGADILGVPFLIGKGIMGGGDISPLDLMTYRVRVMQELPNHPIHLLGVALPQEGVFYGSDPRVVSVDTSNPVLHGMFEGRYREGGISTKRPELLADLLDEKLTEEQRRRVFHNIRMFMSYWAREATYGG